MLMVLEVRILIVEERREKDGVGEDSEEPRGVGWLLMAQVQHQNFYYRYTYRESACVVCVCIHACVFPGSVL